MRLKVSLFALAAVSAATSAVLLDAVPASAINCPPGTQLRRLVVGDRTVNYCFPYQQCDPGACDPTAAPQQR